MSTTEMTPEMEALKGRLRTTWMSGDFGVIARMIAHGGDEFVDRLNITPGMKVLDVACGTGNTAIPEAKKERQCHRPGSRFEFDRSGTCTC